MMKPQTAPLIPDSKFHVSSQWQWHWRTLLKLRDRLLQQAHENFTAAATLQKADDPDLASLASEEHEFQSLIPRGEIRRKFIGRGGGGARTHPAGHLRDVHGDLPA